MLSVIKGYMQAKLGQRGAEMVEYAIVIACIAVVGAAVYLTGDIDSTLEQMIKSLFTKAETTINPTNN